MRRARAIKAQEAACLLLPMSGMQTTFKFLLALATVAAFSLAQPAEAKRVVSGLPSVESGSVPESVPDGGSTFSLLGLASLGLVVLRRKLSC